MLGRSPSVPFSFALNYVGTLSERSHLFLFPKVPNNELKDSKTYSAPEAHDNADSVGALTHDKRDCERRCGIRYTLPILLTTER